jgi:NADP-dependent 3-hydroxy acid dehydrogenase YdfG
MLKTGTILITGTTTGLGKAFLSHYNSIGWKVLAINRRPFPDPDSYPNAKFFQYDIGSSTEVSNFLTQAGEDGFEPDVFILNAGINQSDNIDGFNYDIYQKIMDINLTGVMTFLGAISKQGLKNKIIFTLSSTSNIIPNPGNIGYHLSKINLKKTFDLLRATDKDNIYKTAILGPVHTNIMDGSPPLEGINKIIFNFLAVPAEKAVSRMILFLNESGKDLYYTPLSAVFYYTVSVLLIFFPFLYSGSSKK